MKKIAFIGTGVMGSNMIKNLNKNYSLNVYNRTFSKAKKLENDTIKAFDNIIDCVKDVDIICTMVGMPSDVSQVYEQIFSSNTNAKIAIDFTTSSPNLAVQLYNTGKQHDISVIDCPVSGGESGAVKGTLSCMVGGDYQTYQQIEPLLSYVGTTITYCGKAGSGQHVKAVNQILIAGAIAGVSEAMFYAQENNLDPDIVFKCVENGAAASWQLSNHGRKQVEKDYNPGFFIKHFIKDMNIAIDNMNNLDKQLPVTTLVCDLYKQLQQQGLDELGIQALIKYYEKKD